MTNDFFKSRLPNLQNWSNIKSTFKSCSKYKQQYDAKEIDRVAVTDRKLGLMKWHEVLNNMIETGTNNFFLV